jgi:hypothetical protein
MQDRFNRLVDKAGVRFIRLYDVRHTYATLSFCRVDPKIVADRIGHANMAYTLAIYTHKSAGKDRGAAETVAGVLLGTGWTCSKCKAVYIGTVPKNGLCPECSDRGQEGLVASAWVVKHLRPLSLCRLRGRCDRAGLAFTGQSHAFG